MVPEVIQLTKVGVCGCGQLVAPGERAGYSPALDQVVCLSCLSALQGEPRRRFRVPRETFEVASTTAAPLPTAPAPAVSVEAEPKMVESVTTSTTSTTATTATTASTVTTIVAEPSAASKPVTALTEPAPALESPSSLTAESTSTSTAATSTADTSTAETRAARRQSGLGGEPGQGNPVWASVFKAANLLNWRRSADERTHGPVDPMLDSASEVLALHHRTLPGRRASIDHLAIGPGGVYVVEVQDGAPLSVAVRRGAKHEPGSALPQQDDLIVGGHAQNHLLTALDSRVAFVKETLTEHGLDEVPVVAVLCFLRGMPALVDRRLTARKAQIVAPKGLGRLVSTPGPLEAEHRSTLLAMFDAALPVHDAVESA